MRERVVPLLLALGILSLPSLAHAQALGTVAGVVKDASGGVLPGVTVEAASPALIEKVRTVVTDGTGQYRIINLTPGTYSVTFTLTGFNTVKREGVGVSVNVTTSVDAELRVGTVQETITVSGESPIVDVQSSAQTRTMTAEAFKELPSGGSWIQMAALVPAIRAGNTDVGGVLGDQTGAQVEAHGSRPGDGVSMIDGLRIGNMYISSNLTNMSLSPLLFDQVDVQLSGQMAETGTNGVIMNAIPKAGGNSFSGTLLANGSSPSLQGNNVTPNLQARGLAGASSTLKKLYDINGAIGGPIKQDRLWFYATSRYFTNEYYLAGRFYSTDVTAFQRTNDAARQAFAGTYTYDNNGRVTWAISDKQKLSGWYAYQYKVDPHWLLQIFNQSPESSRITTWHTQLSTTKWTYTATNRLLFEAGLMAGESPDTILLDPAQVASCPGQGSLSPRCIAIVEQSTNFTYRAPTQFDFDDRLPSQTINASASYVTGSHNFKVGFENQRGYFWRGDNNDSTGGIWYTLNAGVPAFVNIQAPATGWQDNLDYNLGFFAQDRWTLNRVTVSGGVRVDFLNTSTEPFTLGPHRWLPNRNVAFAAVENVPNWKDVNPRVSVAYDLFGDGKTALKGSASRGVQQESIAIARANNPANTVSTLTNRVWTDANGNFIPDCDLTNGALNGECGPNINANFGSAVPGTRYDPAIMDGWGLRPYNWEFSAGIQQEIAPRVSLSFGYFRRINGNFNVVDNEALARTDFTQYSATVPTDTRLPNSGQTVTGLFDQNINPPSRNVVKDASQFGKQQLHWDGVDLTVDARLRNGVLLQGGVSTGKTTFDNCQIIDDVPESLLLPGAVQAGVQSPVATLNSLSSASFCHQETPYLPQYKALASYTLPWYGIRVSGTLQSLPGPQISATNIYNNANRLTSTTLGRPFTLAQANVNVVGPGTFYGDRLNQIDLRLTKIINLGGRNRLDLNVDFFNAFNSDAVIAEIGAFGPAWRRPLTVIQPRFVKFGARWDF
ncbi:MAG TPA: carboxypeptidase regulatory-like domain-containing protein [Vicinamibacterales bacterium]|nr:carboxypeptidase regulatory-like domain-containing protein [Vicinamibacterales bacterium]